MIRNRYLAAVNDLLINSPKEVDGLMGWYDFSDKSTLFTDAGSTAVVNDGDLIHQANDKSGNNRHMVAYDTINGKPAYKTGIQNGLSVARHDGTNDILRYYNAGDLSLVNIQSATIYYVAKTTNIFYAHRVLTGSRLYIFANYITVGATTGNFNSVANNMVVLSLVIDANKNTVSIGGLPVVSINNTATGIQKCFWSLAGAQSTGAIKPTVFSAGDCCEILYYSTAHDELTSGAVQKHLNRKWNIK